MIYMYGLLSKRGGAVWVWWKWCRYGYGMLSMRNADKCSPERGWQLIQESGHDQDKMIDCVAVMHYLWEQRELVLQRGQCRGRCKDELTPHHVTGEMVCKHTLQPCPGRELATLIEIYSEVGA